MRDFRKIAVVGAGTMGSAIAQHFLMKGLPVALLDASAAGLARGQRLIAESLDEAVERGLLDGAGRAAILARLRPVTEIGELAGTDLVVEAVFEDLAVKRDLFRRLEPIVGADCVLATNTSSFRVGDVAEGLARPERVVGTHYFYHAAKNKLIELVAAEQTDPGLLPELEGFYSGLGKTPIRTADSAGFAVNRFFIPWLNEAVRVYEEGLGSIHDIDAVGREAFGAGMGPFALMNATGVPIARHGAEGLAGKLGPFYAPAAALSQQVASGRDWDVEDRLVTGGGEFRAEIVRRRLLAASLGCAAQLVSEGVADATATDLGARAGLRWPRGPFELMAALGKDVVADMIRELYRPWKLPLPAVPFSQPGEPQLEWVQSAVHGDAGFVIFNLPDRMNPLGEFVVTQLEAAWDRVEADPRVRRIFLAGRGKAFVAGADIRFFVDSIRSGDLERIHRFTARGHALLARIAASAKPTCAWLDGMALGGGLELALACRYRLGTRNTLLAFPETGIGIVPGLGGTQRTTRLAGLGVAKYLVATGRRLDAAQALAFGLVDRIVEPVRHLEELAGIELGATQAGRKPQPEIEQAFTGYDGGNDEQTLAAPALRPWARDLARKAPLALRAAMRLMDEGAGMDLAAALRRELDGATALFSTQDALTGLSSVLDGTRPQFSGRQATERV